MLIILAEILSDRIYELFKEHWEPEVNGSIEQQVSIAIVIKELSMLM